MKSRTLLRPQVVAHRGASHENAEHTLGAYLSALEVGAGALECDVRLTADGHLVCVHDRDLRRTASSRGLVSTMELADLDQLDFAAWKNPWAELDDEIPETDEELRGVLTLRRLLETVASVDRRVELAIETKHPTRYAGLVEQRLAKLLGEFGWTGPDSPVRVMSFSNTALHRIRRLAPDLQLVQLLKRKHHWPMLANVLPHGATLGPGIAILREFPRFGQRLTEAGHELHVWTVNTEADLKICLDLGVGAVITDRPGTIIGLLQDR